jgi:hypothetical protein
MDKLPFNLIVGYDGDGGVSFIDTKHNITASAPQFDCSRIQKCGDGIPAKLCNDDTLKISRVSFDVVLNGQIRLFTFRTLEKFDRYLWYFAGGLTLYSDKPVTDPIQFTSQTPKSVWVRVIGMKNGTGCFAIFEGPVALV